MDEINDCWDKKAAQWRSWVGDRGDNNRYFNSDPVMLSFAGDLAGLHVLDAGCGSGYLSVMLATRAASVMGVDASENMIIEASAWPTKKVQRRSFVLTPASRCAP
jgi:2-polyprenyl-3-methyl-5-hydroxy-6-metoxy-1,4-benzoquinol methylase